MPASVLPRFGRPARREKTFAPRYVPLDRNAKVRVLVYARAWSARHRQPGQHRGPLTRAFLEVLEALTWAFHNSRTGCCFPSYERIAERAGCARSTVAAAVAALEAAGVLTWAHRITRVQSRERDLFGHWSSRWRVLRTSNAYTLLDPQQRRGAAPEASKSESPTGTQDQGILPITVASNSRGASAKAAVEHAAGRAGGPAIGSELTAALARLAKAVKPA